MDNLEKAKFVFKDRLFTVSNVLSISRVILLPFFVFYIDKYSKDPLNFKYFYFLIMICVLAILSDYLDGFLARLLHQETIIGRYLDPVCDKIVTIGALGSIVYYFKYPLWVLLLYILREIVGIWLGSFLFFKRDIQGKPNIWGKIGVGIIAISILWYVSMPILSLKIEGYHLLKLPEISIYLLLFVLFIGIVTYSKTYWDIVINPDKVKESELQMEKKKFIVLK